MPTWKKFLLIVLMAVLTIAAVGHNAAIFLPAFVGKSPDSLSLFGSLIWLGLLFMCIWAFRQRSKGRGFSIGAFVGFLLYFSAGFISGYYSAEQSSIEQAVQDSNEDLPRMIDEHTSLDKATIDQQSKNYYMHLSFVKLSKSEIDLKVLEENFNQSVRPALCTDKTFRAFLDEKYTINFVYTDSAGQSVYSSTIRPRNCS